MKCTEQFLQKIILFLFDGGAIPLSKYDYCCEKKREKLKEMVLKGPCNIC